MPGELFQCDFCSSEKVRWRYPAHDVVSLTVDTPLGQLPLGSTGHWAACHACHDLIEQGHWAQLLERSVREAPDYMKLIPPADLRWTLLAIIQSFQLAKFGDAIRL